MFLVSCAMMTLLAWLKVEDERRRERKMWAGRWAKSLHNHAFLEVINVFGSLIFFFWSKAVQKKFKKSLEAINHTIIPQLLIRAASINTFWYLFIRTFLWKFWIIWYFERRITWCTYRYSSDKCESFRWSLRGEWFMVLYVYCTDFSALAANVNNDTCDTWTSTPS